MTPAEAHVWIAVFAAMWVKKSTSLEATVEAIVAADIAVHELQDEGRKERILDNLDAALKGGR